MNSYQHMADLYDQLMDEVDYEAWAAYVTGIFSRYERTPQKILDAACGTGNLTLPLAGKGFRMWGLDLSAEMLAVAEQKAREARLKIRFLNQDMAKLQLNERFDAVTCMCDGVNYITEEAELQCFFKSVFDLLEPNGIFVFDISSEYKLRHILGDNVFYEEKNNIHYIWNNNFIESNETVEMDLVFFVPQGQLFKKLEEHHTQKVYAVDRLKCFLAHAGFSGIEAFKAFSFDAPEAESDRVFFAASKNVME